MPGDEVDERGEVAAVERQLLDRPLFDDRADFGRIRPQQRRLGHDGGRLFEPADFEPDVDARPLIDLQDDAVPHPLLESLHVDLDRVGARREEGRRVAAVLVRDVRVRGVLRHLTDGDVGAWHDAVRVADRADDGAGRDLGGNGCCHHERRSGKDRCAKASIRHRSCSSLGVAAETNATEVKAAGGICHPRARKSRWE